MNTSTHDAKTYSRCVNGVEHASSSDRLRYFQPVTILNAEKKNNSLNSSVTIKEFFLDLSVHMISPGQISGC